MRGTNLRLRSLARMLQHCDGILWNRFDLGCPRWGHAWFWRYT